ncbi:beta-galactosidase [candidate division KSB1 bacterium]
MSRSAVFLIALISLIVGCSPSDQGPSPTFSAPRPAWLQEGIFNSGGTHEPYIYIMRRGGYSFWSDLKNIYLNQHTPEFIDEMKARGVNLFHTHFYKGFGIQAETPEWEMTKKLAELVHQRGMRIDTYTQWNSLMYETFFAEEPRAKDWIQIDEMGKPIAITYGYQQNFRFRPCFNDPGYRAYYKRILDYVVDEVKTDFIHFDNFDVNPEPDACHCPDCRTRFIEYLSNKYPTPESRVERFGFADISRIRPPTWNAPHPPDRLPGIKDSVLQEWIDFRTWYMAENLLEMADYVRRKNPEVAIEVNCHGIIGGNRFFEAGIDHAKILKITDVLWSEEGGRLNYLPGKPMPTRIRSFKLTRRFDRLLFVFLGDSPKTLAEALAFNGTIGNIMPDADAWVYNGAPGRMLPSRDPDHFTVRYRHWYESVKEHIHHHHDKSPVAVARLYPSMAYSIERTYPQVHLVEQFLIQNRIPFDYVLDEHLDDLSDYDLLILPDQANMSDEQVRRVINFVRDGGGLLATDMTGAGTEWGRLRSRHALFELFGGKFRVRVSDGVLIDGQGIGLKGRVNFGSGRAAYLPQVGVPENMPTSLWSDACPMPTNLQQIMAAITWAAGGKIPVRINAPMGVVANMTEGDKRTEICLHLINARNDGPIPRIPVELDNIEGVVKSVTVLSPDRESPLPIKFIQTDGSLSFTINGLDGYDLVVIET